MFRTLARAAPRVPRKRPGSVRSAVSRSAGASILLTDSILTHHLAGLTVTSGSVTRFHTPPTWKSAKGPDVQKPPFEKLMAANRGEIATRIVRAASELGIKTAGIYAHEGKR